MIWYLWALIAVVIIIVLLIFESTRDFLADILDAITGVIEDVFGDFGEQLVYVISFAWIGDIPEFFGAMFEGLTEFSVYGVTFGLLALTFSYATKYINLSGNGLSLIESMTQYYPEPSRTIWTIVSYAGAFIGGYLMGKYFENT